MGIGHIIFSRNTSNGLNCSSFYLNANNDSSNSNANIDSASLLKHTTMPYTLPVVGRTNDYIPLSVGRETEGSGVTRQ